MHTVFIVVLCGFKTNHIIDIPQNNIEQIFRKKKSNGFDWFFNVSILLSYQIFFKNKLFFCLHCGGVLLKIGFCTQQCSFLKTKLNVVPSWHFNNFCKLSFNKHFIFGNFTVCVAFRTYERRTNNVRNIEFMLPPAKMFSLFKLKLNFLSKSAYQIYSAAVTFKV